MLPDILENVKFALCGEAETGSAGEQPVRNSHPNWNEYEVGIFPTSLKYTFWLPMPFKTHLFFVICPFYAGAVH